MDQNFAPLEGAVSEGASTSRLHPEDREIFAGVLRALQERGVPFLMAGGFVFSHYSGLWRNTKDMDIVVTRSQFDRAVEAVRSHGLADLHPVLPYDRSWIFRGYRDSEHGRTIVDVIHQFANHADVIDETWFQRGVAAEFAGERVEFVAPEDLIWMKLMVFQRERCDWPDLLNVIRGLRGQLDWERLLRNAGANALLVAALVDIYDWLCPAEREYIPAYVREELAHLRRHPEPARAPRNDLFDSRAWFTTPGAGLKAFGAGCGGAERGAWSVESGERGEPGEQVSGEAWSEQEEEELVVG